MSSDRPNFLSQPVVKNIFMFRNGDPYFEARRIVINEKRVCNFETLLREVTGGIQAPFGAVRTIYTPRRGHKVDCMESLQSGEQYVAAGKERFKKLDYQQIAPRKKKMMMQTLPLQVKPLPPNRIIVSARFLKPIKEPCPIFVVANGDVLNPVVRLLIHQRMMEQFDKILELITEKMGLRILGGVRSLFTYEGHQVTDGNKLECGQLYVAVGRERFKKLPYSDLLFPRPKGTRRLKGMKAYSLPPIYRFAKQRGNSKSTVRSSDSGDGESKGSPQDPSSSSKEHLPSAVRDISQARLLSLRTRKSRQSITDNDDPELKAEDGDAEGETLRDMKTEEKSEADGVQIPTKENSEKTEEKVETPENISEVDVSTNTGNKNEKQETNMEKEEKRPADEETVEKHKDLKAGEGDATTKNEQKVEEVKEDVKEEVTEESRSQVNDEEQESNSSAANGAQTKENKEKEHGLNTPSEAEKEQDSNTDKDKQEKDGGNREESSNGNDEESGEKQRETEISNSPAETWLDNERKESENVRISSRSSIRDEDARKTKEEVTKQAEEKEERIVTGEASVSKEAELQNNSDTCPDAAVNEENAEEENSKNEKDE